MYFYGPVQSRRLGLSLGVDLCGQKQCSFDCLYCQVGRTPNTTLARFDSLDINRFKKELENLITINPDIKYITFAGSGEPTLHQKFDKICELIRSIAPKTKIALITNSTLLTDEIVRREVEKVDLLVPSLDSARQTSFEKINRPYPGLKVSNIINALKRIKRDSHVEMWLEIMLLGGVNDSKDDLIALREAVVDINPDKVQINLPVRPTLDPVSFPEQESVDQLIAMLEDHVEIICDKKIETSEHKVEDIEESIIAYVSRRPALLTDLSSLVSLDLVTLASVLDKLEKESRIHKFEHNGKVFVKAYEIK